MNIVSMAMNYLGPSIVSKIASSLGVNNTIVNGLISAALPSILGAVTGTSRTGAGAGALFDAIGKMDWGGSDSNVLESALDGGGIADFAKGGGDMLGGLLGGNVMETLAGALGKSQGVTSEQAGSILGMLGPVALGSLKDQVVDQGLDASGLAQFLGDQQSNIAGAMPAGFAGELQGLGLFDQLGDAAGSVREMAEGLAEPAQAAYASASETVADTAGAATETVREAVRDVNNAAAGAAKGGVGILPWIIGLVAVVAGGWYFLAGSDVPEVPDVPTVEIMAGDTNIGEEFTGALDGFTSSLGTVTDAASAEAALPDLEGFGASLDNIGGMVDQLPEAAKGPFAGMIGGALETVTPLIENVLGIEGVGDILGPVLNGVIEKLTALAG